MVLQDLLLSGLTWAVCAIVGVPVLLVVVYVLARTVTTAHYNSKIGYLLQLKKLGVNDGR